MSKPQFSPTPPRLNRRQRLAGAGAALVAGGGVLAAVLTAFANVSSDPWLAPTPELLEAAAGCRELGTRGLREACMRSVLADASRASRQPTRVAQAPPAAVRLRDAAP